MELKILGSSSKGNCYLLDNGNDCLMIECGIPFKDVQKAVNFGISRIAGVIMATTPNTPESALKRKSHVICRKARKTHCICRKPGLSV